MLPLLSTTLLCLALSATARSSAQTSDDGSAKDVEQLLEQGVELRRKSQDEEALALFRRALELDPESSRAQAHLGTTYQALGRWLLADILLTQALAHREDTYIERHRAALEQAQQYVQDHLGLFEVRGGIPGAQVLLNGQKVATLPMSEPARVPVGAYQLEVSLTGHYVVTEPVRISRRALTRQTVELLPLPLRAGQASPASATGAGARAYSDPVYDTGGVPSWVPWTLAGVSAGAAAVATVAWIDRQRHSERWNDDAQCLNVPGATRQSLCGDERTRGLRSQAIALVSGGLSLGLATAAIWTGLSGGGGAPAEAGLTSCTVGFTGASCFGRF